MSQATAYLQARLAGFANRRLWCVGLLGIAAGLPFGALADPLSAWLVEYGLGLGSIGLFAFLSLPYTLKPLWAPLLDHYRPPFLLRRLGRRRGWLLLLQLLGFVALSTLGWLNPATHIWATVVVVFCFAVVSASQDILVDAVRVEILTEAEAPLGAAVVIPAYRIGMLLAGAGGLALAQTNGWTVAWVAMAACLGFGALGTLLLPLQATPAAPANNIQLSSRQMLLDGFVMPFRHLLQRRDAGWFLAFVLLYRISDGFFAPMRVPMLLAVGFDKMTLAEINKLVGFAATLVGGFVAQGLIRRFGLYRLLWWGAFAQGASNLLFWPRQWMGADRLMLMTAVASDNFIGGVVSIAVVVLLTRACNHPDYTASQYAALSAVVALSRTMVSGVTGYVALALGWSGFLWLSAVLSLIALPLLWRIKAGFVQETRTN
jgi:PAT family beta-lactamase induction signal transducer AmpG